MTVPKAPQVLVVTQSSATGQAYLPGTLKELKLIEDQATKNNILSISLKGSDATVLRVKKEMGNASWVHFACHGVQYRKNPTDSALLLSGSSRLTLSEIDVASTYVLRPRLGIKCPEFRMVRERT